MNRVSELFEATKGQAGSAGTCDVSEWMNRVNVIGPEIMDRIEARGTVSTWCLPVCQNCVVLPSDLDTPIQAWLCGEALGFRSQYWLGRLVGDIPTDMLQECPWKEVIDDGRYAYTQVYPIPVTNNDVFEVVARSQSDEGKTVELRYAGPNGREITHEFRLRGNRIASTPSKTGIGDITHILKPRTNGAIELWIRNLSTGNRMLVSVYDGHDEHPAYRLMHLTGCAKGSLVIKGRKKWMPVRSEDDIVPFGRVAVWRVALMAEAALANRSIEEFNALVAQAVDLLDKELTGLRPKGTAEIVDFVTPWTALNQRPVRRGRYY